VSDQRTLPFLTLKGKCRATAVIRVLYSGRIDRFERTEDEALAEVDACEEKIELLTDEKLLLASENDALKNNNAQLIGQIKRLEESVRKQDEVAVKYELLLKEKGRLQYMIIYDYIV
jgi:hypothetical protein